jgi:hypothetical protein
LWGNRLLAINDANEAPQQFSISIASGMQRSQTLNAPEFN